MIIKIDKFEGPLYLLLQMIEEEKMDITEVSLVKIADEYIDYIKATSNIDPEHIADFLVVAAKLLLLKSRALLPYLYPKEDIEVDDFEAQIKMYKEFLEATKVITKIIAGARTMYGREFNKQSLIIDGFTPPKKLNINDFPMVFADVIGRLRPVEKLGESTIREQINIEDKISEVKYILTKKINFFFRDFIGQAKTKTEVIVGFLAILELMKQRECMIEQMATFGEIEVQRINNLSQA